MEKGKKDITLGELRSGAERGLSVEQTYKEAGFTDYRQRAKKFEKSQKEMAELANGVNVQLIRDNYENLGSILQAFGKAAIEYFESIRKKVAPSIKEVEGLIYKEFGLTLNSEEREKEFIYFLFNKYAQCSFDEIPNMSIGKLSEDFLEFANGLYRDLKSKLNSTDSSDGPEQSNGDDLIKPELFERLKTVEQRAKNRIELWRTGKGTKIECAAFVEKLHKLYFKEEYREHRIKWSTAFAKQRYNINIEVQLSKGKEPDRESTYKSRLIRYFID